MNERLLVSLPCSWSSFNTKSLLLFKEKKNPLFGITVIIGKFSRGIRFDRMSSTVFIINRPQPEKNGLIRACVNLNYFDFHNKNSLVIFNTKL